MKSGLLSITFRKHEPKEIIQWVREAALDAIEWGGDIHVPPGDIVNAREVGERTREAGIEIAAYGSYYRLNGANNVTGAFERIIETALALQTPSIRVWAGERGSDEADSSYREAVVEDTIRIAELAQAAGITIDIEYHGGTLTDTTASTEQLFHAVNHANVRSYWQPRVHDSFEERLASIHAVAPWLSNIHVFHWDVHERLPLEAGSDDWKRYIECIQSYGDDRYLMLEFVKNDDPEQFMQDAAVLKSLLIS